MRLRTYTLHIPEMAVRGDARALDEARIVPDGFSWSAYAFSVLWFVRHRLWLSALFVLGLLVGLAVIGRFVGLSPSAAFVIVGLASVLIGLEASSLRRWTYGRGGRPARDAVVAASADEAEAKLIARWLDPAAKTAPVTPLARRGDESVIGLFPSSEGYR